MAEQDQTAKMSGKTKALLIGVGMLVVAGLAALIILRPGSGGCEGIIEQTAPRLEANLEIIQNKGAFAVSREKIQELSEGAQKVGLHLKTCCSVLEGGRLDPGQFQQCVDKASAYEKQVALVVRQVTEAAEAKEKGASSVVEEKVSQIAQTIQAASGEVAAFGQQVAQIKRPQQQPKPVEILSSGSEKEPNDTAASATVLPMGEQISGEVANVGDSDYYKLVGSMSVRDRVRVRLENLSDTLRPNLLLYNQDKALLRQGYNDTYGANYEFSFTAEPGVDYYLKVEPYGSMGRYNLVVEYQNAQDAYEPNDDPARHKPTPIQAGKSIQANIMDEQDKDWYYLAAAPTNKIRVRLDNRSSSLRPNILIFNELRSLLTQKYNDTPGASLDFTIEAVPGKAYYLKVDPYGTYGAYQLRVD
jgi:hypothetical protein